MIKNGINFQGRAINVKICSRKLKFASASSNACSFLLFMYELEHEFEVQNNFILISITRENLNEGFIIFSDFCLMCSWRNNVFKFIRTCVILSSVFVFISCSLSLCLSFSHFQTYGICILRVTLSQKLSTVYNENKWMTLLLLFVCKCLGRWWVKIKLAPSEIFSILLMMLESDM